MPVFTLADIAAKIGGTLHGDPEIRISGTAEIDKASAGEITFLANPKYGSHLEKSHAAAVIVDGNSGITPAIPYILCPDAYYGFLQAFLLFNPPRKLLTPGIHPSAVVHETARLGAEACIGANAYVGPGVTIGERTQVFPNCVILDGSQIGSDCILYPLVSIRENCRIGDRVIIHNGAVIGSDGFGFAPYQGAFHKIPQVGIVVIEDDVEIGANATIDRATMGQTRVRKGVKLDNLVHLAHNVTVGEHTVIVAQTGVAGSTRIGSQVMIGGQVAVAGHISVGDGARIGACSGVSKSVAAGETVFGFVARPIMKTKRIEAVTANLPELLRRVQQLEKKLEALQEKKS